MTFLKNNFKITFKLSSKTIYFLSSFLLFYGTLSAQTKIEDIKRMYPQGVNAIIENDEVTGYYSFNKLDKGGKGITYVLNIMDKNLEIVNTEEIVKPGGIVCLESVYNGKAFCISFINYNKKVIEYMVCDEKGSVAGTYITERLSGTEMDYMTELLAISENSFCGGIVAVPNKGFVRYGMEKGGGWRYVMEMINNDGKKVWSANSENPNKKAYETAKSMLATENTIVTMVSTRGKSAKETEVYCVFTDIEDGKDVFRTEPVSSDSKKYMIQPIGVSYDAKTNDYFVYGEYFKSDDKYMSKASLGFYFQEISHTGTLNTETFASWEDEISKVIKVDAKGKMAGGMSIAIHNMVKTADGKIFAIGEQFKKAINSEAVAMSLIAGGSNSSLIQIELNDMVIFEFDDKLNLKKAKIFDKDKTEIALPPGYEFASMPMMGFILKTYSLFDYNFTMTSPDKKTFTCAYTNYDKKGKGDKDASNYLIGNITYDGDDLTIKKIKLENKPSDFKVMPGKPGYVAIMEYYYKKKYIEFRLEDAEK